jgi:hypothetical protein
MENTNTLTIQEPASNVVAAMNGQAQPGVTNEHRYLVSVNSLCINKPAKLQNGKSDWRKVARNFSNRGFTLDGFKAEIKAGHAFTAQLKDEVDKDGRPTHHPLHRIHPNLLQTNVACVDIDERMTIAQAESNDFVRKYCSFGYTSFNHQKEKPTPSGDSVSPPCDRFRLVFRLEKPIFDADNYVALVTALIDKFQGSDESCKDACRLFYGNTEAQFLNLDPGAFLPEEVIKDLISGSPKLKDAGWKKKKSEVEAGNHQITPGARYDSLYRLGCEYVARGLSFDEAKAAAAFWNKEYCKPPHATSEVERAIGDAYHKWVDGRGKSGADIVAELNRTFALATMGSNAVVIDERDREYPNFLKVSAFRDILANQTFTYAMPGVDGKGNPADRWVSQKYSELWLTSPMRREYTRVVYMPSGCRENEYNLWQGFTGPKPTPGDWKNIEFHIHDIICNRDETVYGYVMMWLGHLLQKPGEKPGVALVMRGGKGIGKGIFADHIVRGLVGSRNYISVSDPQHIIGRFNKHLAQALCVFCDEAFFAGDRSHKGKLDNFISEKTIPIEPKGIDLTSIDSFHRVIMATNNTWVVNSGEDERRYLLLDVSDAKKRQNQTYFTPLVEAIKLELPGFMDHLLHLDLSKFDRYYPPETAALEEQKVYSRTTFESFIAQIAEDRCLVLVGETLLDLDDAELECETGKLYEAYKIFSDKMRDNHPLSPVAFGMYLHRLQKPFMVVKDRGKEKGGKRLQIYRFEVNAPVTPVNL